MTTLGEKIRLAREAMGWTQDELAERVNRSRVTVSEWESNKKRPRRTLIPKLCEVLNMHSGAFQPHASGGVVIAPEPKPATLSLITWSDIPLVARGLRPMHAQDVTISASPTVRLHPDEVRIQVVDDSMSPTFNPGDIVHYSQSVKPWDGCQVVAWIEGDEEGVLRNYRKRGDASFDLWPNNPEFDTMTLNTTTSIKIVGVVVSHLRVIAPPHSLTFST